MPIRLAASLAAAALLCACSGQKGPPAAPAASSSPVISAPAPHPGGPRNAPAWPACCPIPLGPADRHELDRTVAQTPAALRGRLRYALAAGDDGKPHLVVYDGEGLGQDGRNPRRPHAYTVFRILNSKRGEHYDPQQNTIVAPIPPPVQRDDAIKS